MEIILNLQDTIGSWYHDPALSIRTYGVRDLKIMDVVEEG
jgi:hypothetical protein